MNTNNETPDERKDEWTSSSFIGLTVSMCTHTTNRSSNNIFVIFVLFLNVVWVTYMYPGRKSVVSSRPPSSPPRVEMNFRIDDHLYFILFMLF